MGIAPFRQIPPRRTPRRRARTFPQIYQRIPFAFVYSLAHLSPMGTEDIEEITRYTTFLRNVSRQYDHRHAQCLSAFVKQPGGGHVQSMILRGRIRHQYLFARHAIPLLRKYIVAILLIVLLVTGGQCRPAPSCRPYQRSTGVHHPHSLIPKQVGMLLGKRPNARKGGRQHQRHADGRGRFVQFPKRFRGLPFVFGHGIPRDDDEFDVGESDGAEGGADGFGECQEDGWIGFIDGISFGFGFFVGIFVAGAFGGNVRVLALFVVAGLVPSFRHFLFLHIGNAHPIRRSLRLLRITRT
mmetsp:Transcript_33123/g.54153  ORF Transcript_33123/g.54153 Transcript_33123/m.54153 type:complete len:297 (+) Transcript_33123:767-1657(+)